MFILKLMPFHKALRSEIVDHSKKSISAGPQVRGSSDISDSAKLKADMNYELRTKNWRQRRLGFTLIELLVVISIIAILVTVIVASFGGTQKKARDARRREDLDAIKKALELAKSDSIGSAWYAACNPVGASCAPSSTTPTLATAYIRAVPADPSGGNYIYVPLPASCTYTVATNIGTCSSYDAIACIENDGTPTGDGVETKPVVPALGSACAGTKIYRIQSP